MILLNLLIIIDIACTFAVIWFVLFMLLMYLYGEGLVSCKNLFPIQLYIYIDNPVIIKYKVTMKAKAIFIRFSPAEFVWETLLLYILMLICRSRLYILWLIPINKYFEEIKYIWLNSVENDWNTSI